MSWSFEKYSQILNTHLANRLLSTSRKTQGVYFQIYNSRKRWILCSTNDSFSLPCRDTGQTLYLSYVTDDPNVKVGFAVQVEGEDCTQFFLALGPGAICKHVRTSQPVFSFLLQWISPFALCSPNVESRSRSSPDRLKSARFTRRPPRPRPLCLRYEPQRCQSGQPSPMESQRLQTPSYSERCLFVSEILFPICSWSV